MFWAPPSAMGAAHLSLVLIWVNKSCVKEAELINSPPTCASWSRSALLTSYIYRPNIYAKQTLFFSFWCRRASNKCAEFNPLFFSAHLQRTGTVRPPARPHLAHFFSCWALIENFSPHACDSGARRKRRVTKCHTADTKVSGIWIGKSESQNSFFTSIP